MYCRLGHTHSTSILHSVSGREVGRRIQWPQYTAGYAEAQRGQGTGWGRRVSGKDLSALSLQKQSLEGDEKETRSAALGEGNIRGGKRKLPNRGWVRAQLAQAKTQMKSALISSSP